jgi:uncharacterized protein
MLIRVSEIPEEGLQIDGPSALPHPFADPAWRLETLRLAVTRDGDVVVVRGELEARVPRTCARCLEPLELRVASVVDTRFVPGPAGRAEERELGAEDLETDVYDHDTLDLGALVETEATLALPMKALCREDCRGLCAQCGANRNATTCACEERAVDPRWAPLKRLAERLSR